MVNALGGGRVVLDKTHAHRSLRRGNLNATLFMLLYSTEEILLSSVHSLTRNYLILSVISSSHGFDPLGLLTYRLNPPASGSYFCAVRRFLGLPALPPRAIRLGTQHSLWARTKVGR